MAPDMDKAPATIARAGGVAADAASGECFPNTLDLFRKIADYVDVTLHDGWPRSRRKDFGSSYRIVWTGPGRGTGHELKSFSGLTQRSQRVSSDPLHVHREAGVVAVAKSLLTPSNGARGIA